MFLGFLGPKSVAAANSVDIREFMAQMSREGASLHGVYRELTILRLFFDFLNLGGVVGYVAPRMIRLRTPVQNSLPILTESQAEQLIGATKTPRERALVEFLYGTGCRVQEASHLKVEDLDFTGKTARVKGKFDKNRIILLTESAVVALRAYIGNRTEGLVFLQEPREQEGFLSATGGNWYGHWRDYAKPGPRYSCCRRTLGRFDKMSREEARNKLDALLVGVQLTAPPSTRPLTSMRLQELMRQIGNRVGLKGVTPHMLRRSFASHLYDRGASIEIIQRLLGHVYLQTTLVYTRQATGRLAQTFEQCHPRARMHSATAQARD